MCVIRSSKLVTEETETISENEEVTRPIHHIGGSNMHPLTVIVIYDRKLLTMEVKTGTSVSVISICTYKEHFSHLWSVQLHTYTDQPISMLVR